MKDVNKLAGSEQTIDAILKQLDCIINEFGSTGMGNPSGASLPGWESIKSQTVFVT